VLSVNFAATVGTTLWQGALGMLDQIEVRCNHRMCSGIAMVVIIAVFIFLNREHASPNSVVALSGLSS
jgi:hypothetical protein